MQRVLTIALIILVSFSPALSEAKNTNWNIDQLLDSCTKYLKAGRSDLLVLYNIKADSLANANNLLDFDIRYKIQNNYILAFQKSKRYDLKKLHIKRMMKLIQKELRKGSDKHILQQQSLTSLAGSFRYDGELDSTAYYLNKAIKIAREFQSPLYIASSLNNMGYFMQDYRGWDTAKIYFDKAIKILTISNDQDSMLYCSIRDNLANYHLFKGDTNKAIDLIETNLIYLNPDHRSSLKLMRWGQKLLGLYLLKRQLDMAQQLIPKLRLLYTYQNEEWHFDNQKILLDYELKIAKKLKYRELTDSLIQMQNAFLKDYMVFLNHRNQTTNDLIADYNQYAIDKELTSAKAAINSAENNNKRNTLIFFLSLFITLLVAIISIVSYKRKVKIKQRDNEITTKELKISSLEREKMQVELENKSKDFSNLLMQSNLQEDWSKYLIDKLQHIRKLNQSEKDAQIKALVIELKQKSSLYLKMHELQKGMEEANTQFYKLLMGKFPKLTKAEKETCGLIRMNLDAKEIALIRNINPSSVRKIKQRIKLKLELSSSTDLYSIIQNI